MCVCLSLTGLDPEREGVLLLDSVSEEEASVAAVVRLSVSDQHVGEVQVSVQPHGHPLVLRDGTHGCTAPQTQQHKTLIVSASCLSIFVFSVFVCLAKKINNKKYKESIYPFS